MIKDIKNAEKLIGESRKERERKRKFLEEMMNPKKQAICKICGMTIDENLVFEHMKKTSHNEFRPSFDSKDNDQRLKRWDIK